MATRVRYTDNTTEPRQSCFVGVEIRYNLRKASLSREDLAVKELTALAEDSSSVLSTFATLPVTAALWDVMPSYGLQRHLQVCVYTPHTHAQG